MENTLIGIREQIESLIHDLYPTVTEEAVLNETAYKLYNKCKDDPEEIKKALINMFLVGQISALLIKILLTPEIPTA